MKKTLFFLLIAFTIQLSQVYAQSEKAKSPKEKQEGPLIELEEQAFDFGEITQGDKVVHTFKVTNTGSTPLVISNVLTTCGCTAPNYTSEPILPNQDGEIEIAFDSRGKSGIQNKIITIISNAVTPQTKIKISANVLPKN
ncbi:MAG: hypothetical protein CMO01_08915 [Thalassobius sp.]|nr:hypothetical protein [Thalassovita sp.]